VVLVGNQNKNKMKKAYNRNHNVAYCAYGLIMFLFMGWLAMGKHATAKGKFKTAASPVATVHKKNNSHTIHHKQTEVQSSGRHQSDSLTCLVELPQPAISEWQLRNSWSDQKRGASLSEESGMLKISQRADGQNYVWVVNPSLTFPVVEGKEYNVLFDLGSNVQEIEKVEVGFASGMEWSSPLLIQSPTPVTFNEVPTTSFSSKTVLVKASQSKNVSLAIKIKWKCSPEKEMVHFLKNIQVCEKASNLINPLRVEAKEVDQPALVVSPSPTKDELKIQSPCACNMDVEVRDPSGTLVLSEKWILSEMQSIMAMEVSPLSPGIYTLFLKGDGKMWRESFVKL